MNYKFTIKPLLFTLLLSTVAVFIAQSQTDTTVVGNTTTITYQTNGTFKVPSGITSLIIECWGGGGGGSTVNTNNRAGGGGGGGAYASSVVAVTPGTSYAIVVGAGGGANTAGGSSSFGGTTVIAAGGKGGSNNSSTGGAGGTASTGSIVYSGGNGANGSNGNYSGGGGGAAGSSSIGGNASTSTAGSGGVGNPGTGTGGNGITIAGTGEPGNTYGGGGSGGYKTSSGGTGGSGANGFVRITYAISSLTCSGTLIPIFTETFGTGTVDPDTIPQPASLTYIGTPCSVPPANNGGTCATCPNDGYYSIQQSSGGGGSGCFGGAWVIVPNDHTGDANGNFYLINAASNAGGEIYRGIVPVSFCSSNLYTVSFWGLNPSWSTSDQQPNVAINVYRADGTTLIASSTSGLIDWSTRYTNGTWRQYSTTFQVPAGDTSVVFKLFMLTPGGSVSGSDLFIDDIQFSQCVPDIAVLFNGIDTAAATVCQDTTFTLSATGVPSYYSSFYQWQDSTDGTKWTNISGATTLSYTGSKDTTGTYYYRLLTAATAATMLDLENNTTTTCGSISDTLEVNSMSAGTASLNQSICAASMPTALTLTGYSAGSSIQWQSSTNNITFTNISGATSTPYQPGILNQTMYYKALVTKNGNTCSATSTTVIVFRPVITNRNVTNRLQ